MPNKKPPTHEKKKNTNRGAALEQSVGEDGGGA